MGAVCVHAALAALLPAYFPSPWSGLPGVCAVAPFALAFGALGDDRRRRRRRERGRGKRGRGEGWGRRAPRTSRGSERVVP